MGAWRWEKKAVVFVRKSFSDGWLLWEAVEDSPCPASSKMDLLLLSLSVMVAATSVLTYQEGESCYCTEAIAAREEWESVTETELQTSRSVKEGEKVSQVPEQRFTCSLWCRPRWGSCAPAAWRSLLEQNLPAACGGPHTRRGRCPKEAVTLWEPALEHIPEGLHLMEGTHTGAVCKELQPAQRIHAGKAWGVLPLRRKECQTHLMNWLPHPFPSPSCPGRGGDGGFKSEVKPESVKPSQGLG